MSEHTPYVKVSVGFYLKDAPGGQLGLRQENWTFGNKPVPFGDLVGAFVYRLLHFYIAVLPTPTDELNAEIENLRRALAELKVEETA